MSRTHDSVEVFLVFAAILAVVWIEGDAQKILAALTAGWIAFATLRSKTSLRALGLDGTGFRGSLWIAGSALLAAALMGTVAWKSGTLHAQLNGFTPATSFPIYLSWSLIQQFILLDFFLIRTLRITRGQPSAVLLAGALFAAAHVLNPLLVSLTFLGGQLLPFCSCALVISIT